jgi:hypothetical protein
MKRALACILAIAGWYLLYPPAHHKGNPDSSTAPSRVDHRRLVRQRR